MCNSRQWSIAIIYNNRLETFPDDVMMQKPRGRSGGCAYQNSGIKSESRPQAQCKCSQFSRLSPSFLPTCNLCNNYFTVLHTVQKNFQAMDVNKYMYIQTPIGLLIFWSYRSSLRCTMWGTVQSCFPTVLLRRSQFSTTGWDSAVGISLFFTKCHYLI